MLLLAIVIITSPVIIVIIIKLIFRPFYVLSFNTEDGCPDAVSLILKYLSYFLLIECPRLKEN